MTDTFAGLPTANVNDSNPDDVTQDNQGNPIPKDEGFAANVQPGSVATASRRCWARADSALSIWLRMSNLTGPWPSRCRTLS